MRTLKDKRLFLTASVLTIIVFLLNLTACISMGRQFDESLVPSIKKGITTKKDIISMFGEPTSKAFSSDSESWSYQYTSSNPTAGGMAKTILTMGFLTPDIETEIKMLSISFKNDLVIDYSLITSKEGTKFH